MIYSYKGNKYMVLEDEHVKMKDPKTGLWVDAVIYTNDPVGKGLIREEDYPTYVRMKSDFEHKFEKCD